DLLEPADRGSVEPVPVVEAVFGELGDRDREVLHQSREVAEPEVDDLRVRLLGEVEDVLGGSGSFGHAISYSWGGKARSGTEARVPPRAATVRLEGVNSS